MEFRLLVDLEVLQIIQGLKRHPRERLIQHLERIRLSPAQLSDYDERDAVGRTVQISVFHRFAIHYWIDHADQHVKVLALKPADV